MHSLKILALSLLLTTGSVSTACAQAEKPPPSPPFGESPPPEPPPSPAPPFGQDPGPKGAPHDNVRHLEAEIHELEAALEGKETTPEQRKKWTRQLELARAELREIRAGRKHQDSQAPPMEHHVRLMARLHEIERLMKKAGPEDQKQLAQEADKIREELKRGDWQYGAKMGPPMDPETAKLHGQIRELEGHAQALGGKLRSLPAANKEDRAELQAKLKEAVTQLFDLREQARAKEVENLKKRLEELTRMLEKRKANRDQIIERRIRQLSGELDELDW